MAVARIQIQLTGRERYFGEDEIIDSKTDVKGKITYANHVFIKVSRILGISHEGPVGELVQGINHLLDLSDAFVRESSASLQHASEGKFYRRVLLRGLLGTYRNAASLINGATDQMQQGTLALERAEVVAAGG